MSATTYTCTGTIAALAHSRARSRACKRAPSRRPVVRARPRATARRPKFGNRARVHAHRPRCATHAVVKWQIDELLLRSRTHQLIRTLTFPLSVASHRCSQSPSHPEIVLSERDGMKGGNFPLSFDVIHSTRVQYGTARLATVERSHSITHQSTAGGEKAEGGEKEGELPEREEPKSSC